MQLELTSDQALFAETTRRFLYERCPTSLLRDRRDDPAGFDNDFWQQGARLGWSSLLVTEDDGGGSVSGEGLRDLTMVAFEFGRFCAPGPLGATNVVAGAIAASGSDDQRSELLPGLLDGSSIATWAYQERTPRDQLGVLDAAARRRNGDIIINGSKAAVESTAESDLLLLTTRDDDGALVQLLVPTTTPGVTITPMQTLDVTRRFSLVTFCDVTLPGSAALGRADTTAYDVERQLHTALVIQLAEIVGAVDKAMEITTEWLFNRYSFGRPLASYQALKHRFADMRVYLEASHAIADAAAVEVQRGSARAGEYVSAAKSFVGAYALEVLHECVQFHGGIGLTFEHDLHLYVRRATLDAHLYGTPAEHRERLTSILEAMSEDKEAQRD